MPTDTSAAPPGAYVELEAALIDEGRFIETLNAALRRAFQELRDYHKATDSSKGTAVVTCKVSLCRSSGAKEFYDVTHGVKVTAPEVKRTSMVKEGQGKLICQPAGSNEDSPDQMLFYDHTGRIIGTVDLKSGEIAEEKQPPAPIGRINKQA